MHASIMNILVNLNLAATQGQFDNAPDTPEGRLTLLFASPQIVQPLQRNIRASLAREETKIQIAVEGKSVNSVYIRHYNILRNCPRTNLNQQEE